MAIPKSSDGREISSVRPRAPLMMGLQGTTNILKERGPLAKFNLARKTRAITNQGLPEYEFTAEAKKAQRSLELANRYGNEESRAKAEEKFGEASKEKVRIKYKLDPATGRYVRADVK